MHSVGAGKPHKVMHWRRNKFSPGRDWHVRIGVRNDRVSARIDDLAVHTRIMGSFLFEDFEGTLLGEMPVTTARNWRGESDPSILQQVSHLFLQVDFD
jgi:hypothetical protein